jgi:hypothetical protein
MADLHALGLETYQAYVGSVAQHTAVHVGRAAEALHALIVSPQKRSEMGASAAQRARDCFSWPVVIGHYNELFRELAARRRAMSPGQAPRPRSRVSPLRGEPFADFTGFSTQTLQPNSALMLRSEHSRAAFDRVSQVDLDRVFARLHGTVEEAKRILEALEDRPGLTAGELVQSFPPARAEFIVLTIVWLAKLGLIDWLDSPSRQSSRIQRQGP